MQNPPLYLAAPVELESPDGSALPSRFSGLAYAGDVIDSDWQRVVIDLASVRFAANMPLLLEHDREDIIGVIDTASKGTAGITVAGALFSDIDEDAALLAKKAQRGLKCQMSVGIWDTQKQEIPAGQSARVNDREIQGPAFILSNGLIREVSIVTLGADANTNAQFFSALPAAGTAPPPAQETPMSEVNPLQAEVDGLKAQVENLTAMLAAAEAKALEAETAKAAVELAARKTEVSALFKSLNREETDEAMAPYLKLSAEAWNAISSDLKAIKPATAPDYLFSAQATGEPTRTPSLNPSDIYASRRPQ